MTTGERELLREAPCAIAKLKGMTARMEYLQRELRGMVVSDVFDYAEHRAGVANDLQQMVDEVMRPCVIGNGV